MRKLIIFGIGHSNQPVDKFIEKLKNHKVEVLNDIRTFPVSRFSPQYSQKALHATLSSASIQYSFLGKSLGGRGINHNFNGAIKWLAELAKTKTAAVMCSEKNFDNCHRHQIVKPALEKLGVEFVEIL